MKQFILLLVCLSLGSCIVSEEKKPGAKKRISEFKTDPISIAQTSKMISYLLKEDFRLERIAREKSLGGYFLASEFTISGDNIGVVLWHCYNPQRENSLPEFFLAVEQVKEYDSITPQQEPQNSTLTIPHHTFNFRERDNEENTILNYIDGHVTADESIPASKPIGKAEVKKYARNFQELMIWIGPHQGNLYCKHPHAFFRNNQAYRNFMKRDPFYVRYYMGLAFDDDHHPNYLRPVLAPVNEDGETIMEKRFTADEPFVQKSVPPPPFN
jgi:hypothetical protein